MWLVPLMYGVTFLAVFGVLWLLCELAWQRIRNTGTADDYLSARWVNDFNTER